MAIQVVSDYFYQLVPNTLTFFFTIVFITLYALGYVFFQRYKYMRRCEKIPGPPAQLPLFGSFTELFVEPESMVTHFVNLYEKWSRNSVLRIWIGPLPFFVLGGAESAEAILSSNKITEKSREYNFLHPWLGTGLLTSTGNKWHKRRKMLTPTFHFKILEDFIHVFNEQSAILIDKLDKKVDQECEIFSFITLCTLDVICETAMGRNVNAQNQSDSDYVQAVYKMSNIVQMRQTRPWLQVDFLFQFFPEGDEQKRCLSILHGFTDQVIQERKVAHKLNKIVQQNELPNDNKNDDDFLHSKKRRLAFLDLLIEASQDGRVLSDLDIREEVDTFMFEGHDTTAAAISWSLYLIAENPSVQEQVNIELDRVFGDDDRPVTMADLSELKYLECCIKEALRICPSVPIYTRQLVEDITTNGYEIPAGATVAIAAGFIHRDPKYFPDPESYKPERFFPENVIGRHPYAYVPFSAGPRNCIGQKFALMEEKVVIASVLRRFHIEIIDKREDLVILGELILRPRDGIRLRLTHKTSM